MEDPKRIAAELSLAVDQAAAVLAGGGALTGAVAVGAVLLAPELVGAAAGATLVFGLASAGAWFMGDEYSDLSLDPPRHDYHLAVRFTPRNIELPPARNGTDAIWNEFSLTQIEMAEAIASLTRSFERLAGARLDLRKPGAGADLLARHITTQRQAVKRNALAAKQRIHALLKLRSRINASWGSIADAFRAYAGAVSAEERRRASAALWDKIMPTLQRAIGNDEKLNKIQKSLMEHGARTTFTIPEELLDSRWNEAMVSMAKELAVFAGERTLTPLRHELDSRT